jgi:two-component system response regulator YesN
MYKVLIADDEEYVVKSLVKGTAWDENGFEVLASANDGVDAYNEILRLRPDVVFTDIRMPGMNGLELIKAVGESLKGVLFIIISGYAEFAYAQKAMNYGAIGYCLKPFDKDEIRNVLKKAKILLDEARKNREEILSLLEDEEAGSPAGIEEYFRASGLETEKGLLPVAVIGPRASELFAGVKSVGFKTGRERYMYFVQYEGETDYAAFFSGKLGEGIRSVGISEAIFSLKNLKRVIDEATTLAYQYFAAGRPGPFVRERNDGRSVEKLIVEFDNAMIRVDIDLIRKQLHHLTEISKSGRINVKHAVNIFNAYVGFSTRLLGEECYEEYVYSVEELCSHYAGIDQMLEHIGSSIPNMVGRKKGAPAAEVKNEYFKKVIAFVDQNFYRDISIQSLSHEYIINPNYLCQLFKRELGMTFTEYVTGLRIHYAKELLQKTELTLEEIANKTGYTDYFYFIRVFKKNTGVSPGQYRRAGE